MPDAVEDGLRPLGAQLLPQGLRGGIARKRARDQTLNGVELPNQLGDLRTGRRPLRRNVVVFPLRVCPAMGEREPGPIARQDLVDRVTVDDHDPAIVAQDLAAFIRRFAREDAIVRDGRRVHAPHGAGRGFRRAHDRPARFVDVDHGRLERAASERLVQSAQDGAQSR